MKGYYIADGYMGLIDGTYRLFADETDYIEKDGFMKAIKIAADTIAILLVSICCAKERIEEEAAG